VYGERNAFLSVFSLEGNGGGVYFGIWNKTKHPEAHCVYFVGIDIQGSTVQKQWSAEFYEEPLGWEHSKTSSALDFLS
jgi:hypothetical protein